MDRGVGGAKLARADTFEGLMARTVKKIETSQSAPSSPLLLMFFKYNTLRYDDGLPRSFPLLLGPNAARRLGSRYQ